MCLEVCCINHHGLLLAGLRSQPDHHSSEDAFLAPTLPAAVKRFRGLRGPTGATVPFICAGHRLQGHRATLTHAFDEYYPTQNALVTDPGLSVRLRKERSQTRHLRVGQPEKIAHVTAPFSEP